MLALVAALCSASGCTTFYPLPKVDVAPAVQPMSVAAVSPHAALPAPPVNGGIYQADRYRPLFEGHRARLAGDTVTVQITEKVSATQKSTSTVDKGGELDANISALPGIKSNSFGRAGVTASNSNTFSGKGTTENSNDFSGTITAVVQQVLPNGHLLIAGEKQIGVNANVDVLRFSGQIDPRSIAPGNTIASTSIANVRIEQRGRGQQAEAQSMGWLSRFFLNLWPI
ncbi:MAG: flagellar basal body L-ring protein FlgH [Aquabacterium sp.]